MVKGMLRVRGGAPGRMVAAVTVLAVAVAVTAGRRVMVAVAGAHQSAPAVSRVRRRRPPLPALPPATWEPAGLGLRGALAGPAAAVGPLFYPGGGHHCTASVVASPGGDLLVTAAHCVEGGGAARSGLWFAPGYYGGHAPQGMWQVTGVFVDDRWARSSDPDDDVAFLTVAALHGQAIERVTGAHVLGVGYGPVNRVRVTGYPSRSDRPVSCGGSSRSESGTQMRFDCDGFTGGTSGGPWVTGGGSVIGVIGGYQRGGESPSVSYSARFGDQVKALYETAAGAA